MEKYVLTDMDKGLRDLDADLQIVRNYLWSQYYPDAKRSLRFARQRIKDISRCWKSMKKTLTAQTNQSK